MIGVVDGHWTIRQDRTESETSFPASSTDTFCSLFPFCKIGIFSQNRSLSHLINASDNGPYHLKCFSFSVAFTCK